MAELIELTCPNCGAKLETDRSAAQARCSHCGTELVIERKATAVAPPVAPELGPEKCPQCGRVDRVQKVSSAYREGKSRGYYDSQTELSKSLNPPGKPLMGAERGPIEILMTGCGYVLMSVLGPGLLLVGVVGLSTPDNFLFVLATIVGLGFTLIFVRDILRNYTDLLGPSAMHQRSAKVKSWEKAMNRWERLYYCARDDGVFIPGETPFIPIDKMQEFLYRD